MIRTFVATVLFAAGLSAVPATAADAQACRPSLTKVSLAKSSAIGGTPVRGRVSLNCAPTHAVTVRVFGFRGVKVPSTVRVAKARRTAAFTVTTYRTTTVRKGVIAASFGGLRKTAALAVRPDPCRPSLKAFTVPTRVYAGSKGTGTVQLTCAPRTTTTLALRSADSRLRVPTQVTVRAGRSSAPVPMAAALVDGDQYRTSLTVKYGTRKLTRAVVVNPGLKTFRLADSDGYNDVTLLMYFTGSVPDEGMTIQLASSHPAVRVPRNHTVRRGTGSMLVVDVAPVGQDTKVTISAALGSRRLTTSTTLLRPFDGTQGMRLRAQEPGDLYGRQFWVPFELYLDAPAPEGGLDATLRVLDDDPERPAVQLDPTTARIDGGSSYTQFQLSTARVTQSTHLVLEATVAGATTTLPLTIHPGIDNIVVPESAVGGVPFTATLELAGPPDVDTVVYLDAGQGGVDLPYKVTIPAGATTATFEVTASSHTEPYQVSITARLGATEFLSNRVTITPAANGRG